MLAKNGKVLFALISATACSITVTLSITPTSSAPALSEVMLASARHIKDVLAGTSLTDCLSRTPAPLRGAAQAHSFYCLRHLGLAQQLRKKLVPREPKDPLLNALMLQALLLVDVAVQVQADRHCFDDRPEVPIYSVHTVVDQAVEAAQSVRALRPFKALLNAVLRRFIRERQGILSQALKFPEAQWNHPEWWINTLKKAYPQNWQSILAVTAIPAPLTLRVNQRRCSVARLLALLEQADIDAWSPGANTVVLAKARPVHQIPAFAPPTEQGLAKAGQFAADISIQQLVKDGDVRIDAIVYEDFLPVSAAGIFQSNLGDGATTEYVQLSNQELFERDLGQAVIDEQKIYAENSQRSLQTALKQLGIAV